MRRGRGQGDGRATSFDAIGRRVHRDEDGGLGLVPGPSVGAACRAGRQDEDISGDEVLTQEGRIFELAPQPSLEKDEEVDRALGEPAGVHVLRFLANPYELQALSREDAPNEILTGRWGPGWPVQRP